MSSDSSMDDCNSYFGLEFFVLVNGSDSSMDDCNASDGYLEGGLLEFRFLYGRL